MPSNDPVLLASTALARASRGNPDPAAVAAARRDLRAAHAERAIRRALDAAPPLTAEQRADLAALLTGGAR